MNREHFAGGAVLERRVGVLEQHEAAIGDLPGEL
jgi:hypothetical protein